MKSMKNRGLSLCLGIVFLGFTGCGETAQNANSLKEGEALSPFNVNKYQQNKLVCDPFEGGGNSAGFSAGLKADLFYLSSGQPRYQSVYDYIEHGTKSDQVLFFSQVNVPTRLFSIGFPLETGELVKTDEGTTLFEYFALDLTANLQLRQEQEEGLYELALLSDDGSVLKVKEENGEYVTIVDNDGNHPTRFGCGETLEMKHGESHSIKISYYQGPRRHISLIPMWRKVEPGMSSDPQCGRQGNKMYFDYNNNSAPQQAYVDLFYRGWEPIQAGNYRLDASDEYNPCSGDDESEPTISNLTAFDDLDGGVRVTWDTDKPATSQVLYSSSLTGRQVVTTSDNVLRLQHTVIIPDPVDGEVFTIRAISITDVLGTAISEPITY